MTRRSSIPEWLTLEETARVGTELVGRNVTVAEVLYLATIDALPLWVRFPQSKVWFFPDDLLDSPASIVHPGSTGPIDLDREVTITGEVARPSWNDRWEVVMERNGKRALEAKYLELTGTSVEPIADPEGAIVYDSHTGMWQLPKAVDHGSEYQVWPKGSEFFVHREDIREIGLLLRQHLSSEDAIETGSPQRQADQDSPGTGAFDAPHVADADALRLHGVPTQRRRDTFCRIIAGLLKAHGVSWRAPYIAADQIIQLGGGMIAERERNNLAAILKDIIRMESRDELTPPRNPREPFDPSE